MRNWYLLFSACQILYSFCHILYNGNKEESTVKNKFFTDKFVLAPKFAG